MKILRHHCSDCDSKFKIEFDELKCDDNPQYCPFCSTYIMEDDLESDEDYKGLDLQLSKCHLGIIINAPDFPQ